MVPAEIVAKIAQNAKILQEIASLATQAWFKILVIRKFVKQIKLVLAQSKLPFPTKLVSKLHIALQELFRPTLLEPCLSIGANGT